MSSTTVKINGVEVASDGSKPIVININLNQPSALGSLLSTWKGQKTTPEGAKVQNPDGAKASTPTFKGEQKVLGAIQIILGLVCVSIAVMFCFVRRSNMFYTGSGFWTGCPLIVAGSISIISGKRGNKCWLTIASFFHWAVVAVTIAGIVIIANDFTSSPYYIWNPDYLCDPQIYDPFGSRNYPRPTDSYRLDECKRRFYRLMCVYNGLRIMLLVVSSLALCIALYSLGYFCKSLCCNFGTNQEEESVRGTNDQEPLMGSNQPEKPKLETI